MADGKKRAPRRRTPATTHEVQAAAEGVAAEAEGEDGRLRVEFLGRHYRVAQKLGAMPAWKFAWYAVRGMDANSMEGLAAMYDLIRDAIDPEDWPDFEQAAIDGKAGSDDLLAVCGQVTALVTARPTSPPSDSSPGRSTTPDTSKASSSSPGMVSVDELLGPSTG